MLVKNQVFTAAVDNYGCEGEGIVKIEGYTIFVPGALKGETVEFKLIKVLKTHGFGKLLRVLTPSPYRQEPVCPVFRRCGGCQMLHIKYEEQLRIKKNHVIDCMKKYAGLELTVHDVLGMDAPFHYRNKAQYPVEGTRSGFYAPRSHDLVVTDGCPVQDRTDTAIRQAVSLYLEKTGAKARHIYTRYGEKQCMVVLVTPQKQLPRADLLVDLLRQIPNVTSIIQNINQKNTNVILGKVNKLLYGSPTIEGKIGNLVFEISPHSFFQVNTVQTQVLYQTAKDLCGFQGNETLLDLYCGIGSIGLFMADSVHKVIGVESVPQAVEDAVRNAQNNGITNAQFRCGLAEELLPGLLNQGIQPDCVILDPPRKGCDASLIHTLLQTAPPKILYISCNPATLARDLALLAPAYHISPLIPVDMFPNTKHVEMVCLLSKLHVD